MIPGGVIDVQPYDFAEFMHAARQASSHHKQAIKESYESGRTLARAEANYHKQLAIAVGRLKAEHGSTIAETLAKGEPAVVIAKEERDSAAARDRAAIESVRLCRDDRAAVLTLGAWSREAERVVNEA